MADIKLNNIMVGRANRSRIINLLYKKGPLTKQDISLSLGLSLPTITQNLKKLMEEGLVEESGTVESTGGRKPKTVGLRDSARGAVGIELSKGHIKIGVIDLHARLIQSQRISKPFSGTARYWEELAGFVDSAVSDAGFSSGQILGVGVATPGIVHSEKMLLEYAPTLQIRDFSLSFLKNLIPYPLALENEANAAGMAELWEIDHVSNAVYVSINKGVGGAVLINNQLYKGKHCRGGELGHMTLHPGGLPCSCGARGCFEAYCSVQRLVEDSKQLDAFFASVDTGERKAAGLWEEYLGDLALGLNNLRMIFDADIIIGGDLAPYLEKYLTRLKRKMFNGSILSGTDASVRLCKHRSFSSVVGAGLTFIQRFLE